MGELKRFKHLPVTVLFIVLTLPLAAMPLRLAIWVGQALAGLVFLLWRSRRRIAIANVQGAIDRGAIKTDMPAEEVVRRNFRLMGRYLAELVHIHYGRGDRIVSSVKVEGLENFRAAKAEGRGVILIGGHCGNWELMALCSALFAGRLFGIARRQSNPYINEFIVKSRKKYGSGVFYKEGALRKFLSILKDGDSVGVLVDQAVIPQEGVKVEVLGAPAWTTKTPALIARRTGAAVVPAFLYLRDGQYTFKFKPALRLTGEETSDTQLISSCVDEYVKEHPDSWLWIHRRWKRA